jgi:hypothetical protein
MGGEEVEDVRVFDDFPHRVPVNLRKGPVEVGEVGQREASAAM